MKIKEIKAKYEKISLMIVGIKIAIAIRGNKIIKDLNTPNDLSSLKAKKKVPKAFALKTLLK